MKSGCTELKSNDAATIVDLLLRWDKFILSSIFMCFCVYARLLLLLLLLLSSYKFLLFSVAKLHIFQLCRLLFISCFKIITLSWKDYIQQAEKKLKKKNRNKMGKKANSILFFSVSLLFCLRAIYCVVLVSFLFWSFKWHLWWIISKRTDYNRIHFHNRQAECA